jgi:hypothetical protein
VGAVKALKHQRSLDASLEQRARSLELHRQAREGVGEDVVNLTGDSRGLLEPSGPKLLLA